MLVLIREGGEGVRKARRQGFLLLLLSVISGLGPSAFNKNKLSAYYFNTYLLPAGPCPWHWRVYTKKAEDAAPCGAESLGADVGHQGALISAEERKGTGGCQ